MSNFLQITKGYWNSTVTQTTNFLNAVIEQNAIFKKPISLKEQAVKDCEIIDKEIARIDKIYLEITSFIKSKSDLSELFNESFKNNREFIAFPNLPCTIELDPENNIFDKKILLTNQKNLTEHKLKELVILIKESPKLMACFEKYIHSGSKSPLNSLLLSDK